VLHRTARFGQLAPLVLSYEVWSEANWLLGFTRTAERATCDGFRRRLIIKAAQSVVMSPVPGGRLRPGRPRFSRYPTIRLTLLINAPTLRVFF
jgi:hypothetical protein